MLCESGSRLCIHCRWAVASRCCWQRPVQTHAARFTSPSLSTQQSLRAHQHHQHTSTMNYTAAAPSPHLTRVRHVKVMVAAPFASARAQCSSLRRGCSKPKHSLAWSSPRCDRGAQPQRVPLRLKLAKSSGQHQQRLLAVQSQCAQALLDGRCHRCVPSLAA